MNYKNPLMQKKPAAPAGKIKRAFKLFSAIEKQDFKGDLFILLGLAGIGFGLFFWFGLGPSLTVVGAVMLALGMFGR